MHESHAESEMLSVVVLKMPSEEIVNVVPLLIFSLVIFDAYLVLLSKDEFFEIDITVSVVGPNRRSERQAKSTSDDAC